MNDQEKVTGRPPFATGTSVGLTLVLAITLLHLTENRSSERTETPVSDALQNPKLRLQKVMLPPPPVLIVKASHDKAVEEQSAKQAESRSPAKTRKPASNVKPQENRIDRKVATEIGRAQLKLLEHGKQEMVQIIWPETKRERDLLYRILADELGMQSVLIDSDFRIYDETSLPGTGQPLNRDKFSGVIRSPAGTLPDAEKIIIRNLKARHQASKAPLIVARIFPRVSDAMILGTLMSLATPDRKQSGENTIRMHYKQGALIFTNTFGDQAVVTP